MLKYKFGDIFYRKGHWSRYLEDLKTICFSWPNMKAIFYTACKPCPVSFSHQMTVVGALKTSPVLSSICSALGFFF